MEQPVNLDDDDDVYNWPWLVAGEMGDWKLTDSQVKKLRDYLLRGGFLMLDDFWGTEEWNRFAESMDRVFPDRPMVEVDDADSIFHTVYDLDDRYQVPGQWALRAGRTYRNDGAIAALEGHPGRQGPRHGGHVVQFRHRRFLGVGGRAGVSGKILGAWASASA